MTKNREELKSYFEQGDTPSAAQFAAWIDAYPHLSEFGFGLNVRSSGDTRTGIYDFYIANDPRYVDGHYIKRVSSNGSLLACPYSFVPYKAEPHFASRNFDRNSSHACALPTISSVVSIPCSDAISEFTRLRI